MPRERGSKPRPADRTLTDRVVSVIDKQTGGPDSPSSQPATIARVDVRMHLCANGREVPVDVDDAIDEAIRNGRVIETDDGLQVATRDA